ncbi:MAG: 5-bromo-4-chloroindolyl phosphate hydrolysis family protein [Lachnospiraceae bacterium]|nr:5-bromo-4-chloroindolyl phosphate hydrolysis family protein [Lachnospiraceae bacterium]
MEKLKLDSEVEEVLIKGYSFVESLRAYNDKIPDEKMSESIDQLESTTKKIFDEVRLHPDKISKLRKLMDYYLPTVDGILSKYAGYDANEISSENIEDSKAKVSESMDIINEGFNNILNSLFSEDKMDITSEVVVLKQMFEGDGLIDPRIKKNKESENNELKK